MKALTESTTIHLVKYCLFYSLKFVEMKLENLRKYFTNSKNVNITLDKNINRNQKYGSKHISLFSKM